MRRTFTTPMWLALVAAVAVVAALEPAPVLAQDDNARELERIRSGIASLERDLDRQLGRRDDGMAGLRKIELALAATRTELRSLNDAVAAQSARQDEIARARADSVERLAGEQAALADQARMSYMTGSEELIKLVLSQESQTDFGRMLVYYDYLNRHRSERIAAVDAERARLAELAGESARVAGELERLRAEQQAEAARLEQDQTQRRALIAGFDAEIADSGDRIERMRAEETELNATIARLAQIVEGFPVNSDAPFARQRGELRWPIDGRLAARFGDSHDEAGRQRWKGVLLEAPAGTTVRAVYGGYVEFAQWLSGMGLFLIVNHGGGYMSLYGYNGALLKESGDLVAAGEAIAEVGDSGGQTGTGLYFGIVLNAEPVDPAAWIR